MAPQARQLLALAAIYAVRRSPRRPKIGGVGLQIVRDWPDALVNGKSPGQPFKEFQRQAIAEIFERGSVPAGPWSGALAADRSGAMDFRGIPHHDRQTLRSRDSW